ncbi:MAG: MFS transporter [Acidobacteria bacterium]|nr:MFS transporter [Acidobacteriota bacterium]
MPILFYLWIAFALNYIDRQMVYSMFPALERDLAFSAAALGWVGTVFLWSYTPALPLAGLLADRYKRNRLIVWSLLLWSAATIGCGISQSPAVFLFWRVIMGLTEALYYPTAMALIASHYPEAARSRALGLHQSAQFAGGVIGGWYGGWAADHTGWRSAFLIAGAAGLIYSPVLSRGLPDSPPPASSSAAPASPWALARSVPFLILAATFASYCSIQWIFFAWFPTYLQDRFHLSMTDSGWASTLFVQTAFIVGILLGAWLADRTQARLLVTAGGAFFCAPFSYFAFSADSLHLSLSFATAFGFFAGGLSANAFAGAFDLIDPRLRGLAAGILNMCGGFASGGMILIAGMLRKTVGFAPLLFVAMITTMLLATLLAIYARRAKLTPCSPAVEPSRV